MSESKKETKRKLHSSPTKDYSSHKSYILDYATHQECFNG